MEYFSIKSAYKSGEISKVEYIQGLRKVIQEYRRNKYGKEYIKITTSKI